MAPEQKIKKRKGAAEASPRSKKAKKTDSKEDPTLESNSTKTQAPVPTNGINEAAVKAKASRKRAADFMDETTSGVASNGGADDKKGSKKSKKSKATEEPPAVQEASKESVKEGKKAPAATEEPAAAVVKKTGKKSKKQPEPEPESELEQNAEEASEDEDQEDDVDDQTAALLKGFESSDEEDDVEDDGKAIEQVPAIPDEKKLRKKLDKAAGASSEPGVVYVGRIPHGFYERQMRDYFSQFGDVTNLRISRNAKTGKSRHFAFIEFASSEVAAIVAKAMDKYLLFGHLLQVRTIPKEQVHENLFVNANKRFRPIPRTKLEARKLRLPKTKEEWEKKTKIAEGGRRKKLAALKKIGYEFDAPQLKSISDLERGQNVVEGSEETPKLLTETAHNQDVTQADDVEKPKEVTPARPKRAAKTAAAEALSPKIKKAKKSKA